MDSAKGGLRQCATLDIAYQNNYKKESSGNDLVVSSNRGRIGLKFLSTCHTMPPGHKGRRQKSTAAARRGRSGNGKGATDSNGRCQKAKAISAHRGPVENTIGRYIAMTTYLWHKQQVFDLEPIVGSRMKASVSSNNLLCKPLATTDTSNNLLQQWLFF